MKSIFNVKYNEVVYEKCIEIRNKIEAVLCGKTVDGYNMDLHSVSGDSYRRFRDSIRAEMGELFNFCNLEKRSRDDLIDIGDAIETFYRDGDTSSSIGHFVNMCRSRREIDPYDEFQNDRDMIVYKDVDRIFGLWNDDFLLYLKVRVDQQLKLMDAEDSTEEPSED